MATKIVKKTAAPKTKKARKKAAKGKAPAPAETKQRENRLNNILAPNFCEIVEVNFERNPPDDPEASEFSNTFGVTYRVGVEEEEFVIFDTFFNVTRRPIEQPDDNPTGEINAHYITIAEKSRDTKNNPTEWLDSEIDTIVRTLIWPKFIALFDMVTSQTSVGWPRLPLTIDKIYKMQQDES